MAARRSILKALGAWSSTLLAQSHEPAIAHPAGSTAGKAGIHPWMNVGDAVAADVAVDGKVIAQLDSKATQPGLRKPPALVFALPPGLKRLQLRGTVTIAGKASAFNRTWTVRDMASVSAPLYDPNKPWLERIRGLAKHLEEGTISVESAKPKPGKKPAAATLQDVEKRLGTPLPAMVKLLADWDIRLGDSSFLHPSSMSTVTDMLLGEWDYKRSGDDGLDKLLSSAVRARYNRSLAVFIEVGDGLGAMAWDPEGVTQGEPPNTWGDKGNPGARPGSPGQGVWYWLHQETLNEPTLLLDDDYRPRTAEAAFTHVFQRFALTDVDSPASENELVVDSANPRGNLLQLHFDEPRKPKLWLRSYDHFYSMY